MPNRVTVYDWLKTNDLFYNNYARSKDIQADLFAEEIIDIADDSELDRRTIVKPDGSEVEIVDQDHINRARLRVDARKWVASKILPKKYGDQLNVLNVNDIQADIKSIAIKICDIARKYIAKSAFHDFITEIEKCDLSSESKTKY